MIDFELAIFIMLALPMFLFGGCTLLTTILDQLGREK